MDAPLSIIVPTLNAERTLGVTLDSLASGTQLICEVVVVDGGSSDATGDLARASGARVLTAARGRGSQLAAGAAATTGAWLMFLHADTVLDPAWPARVAAFINEPVSRERAAVFRFAIDDAAAAARRLERFVAWRGAALGLPYGDQGLLISRQLYDRVGGFAAIPIMEDVELIRRIGRTRLVTLDCPAITSAARYRRTGYVARSARNLICLGLYFGGVPPRLIVRLYG